MEDRLVQIATFAVAPEAHIAKNMLASEGIEAILDGEEVSAAIMLLPATGGVRLFVHAADADRATMLLAEAQSGGIGDEEDDPFRSGRVWVCRFCDTPVSADLRRCPECDSPRADFHDEDPRSLRPRTEEDQPRPRVEAIQTREPRPLPTPPAEPMPPKSAPRTEAETDAETHEDDTPSETTTRLLTWTLAASLVLFLVLVCGGWWIFLRE